MSSNPEAAFRRWFGRLLILLLAVLPHSLHAAASDLPSETEAWLVTYGPGEHYWERFGHNAIWIRDPGLGLDHVFNFGFFDFEQEDFFLRFLQGRMLYFSAARPAREEFAGYIDDNRSIRAQRLDLSASGKLELIDYLLEEVRPENREYTYDYYVNNCSTRIRDAIDLAMGGLLRREFDAVDAPQTWRDQTRRLTYPDFWLYLGLEIGLGSPVDRVVSRWDEMFIPAVLADALASVSYSGGGQQRPLVVEDVMLYRSSLDPPPVTPHSWWPRYLLASLAVVLAAWLMRRFVSTRLTSILARTWLFVSGLAGVVLLYLWFGTDHSVAKLNLNLLVFCPAWIILAVWKGVEKAGLLAVAGLSLVALIMLALPPHQYTQDVLAAFLPLNLAAALALFTDRPSSAGRPDVPASAGR